MRTLVAVLLLAAATSAWFTLALLPAIGEWFGRSDVEPLRLRAGVGDVRHFAVSFRRFVDAELERLATEAHAGPPTGRALTLSGGEPAWHVPPGAGAVELPVRLMPHGALATHVVLGERDLRVPSESALLKELYVAGALEGGHDCSYRAVLTVGDASLGARTGVLRWIDTGGTLVAGESSELYGRASSGGAMRLLDGVRFQRIAAPSITFGSPDVPFGVERPARHPALETPAVGMPVIPRARRGVAEGTHARLELPPGATDSFGRWLVEGDLVVPDGALVDRDLIVSGTLRIGTGSRVQGSLKSAVLVGGEGAIYDGAIVATSRLELGAGSVVAGPVVVEGSATIGPMSRVGTANDRTTISAVSVRVGRGATVYGEVWARAWGEVEAPALAEAASPARSG